MSIPGNWLAVGEEGEDLIPDGTEKNFKLSRKCLECYLVLKTEDNGATWGDSTLYWKSYLESPSNSRTLSATESQCYMVFYRTAANPFEFDVNAEVLTQDTSIIKLRSGHAEQGSLLASNLFGKIPVSSGQSVAPSRYLSSNGLNHVNLKLTDVLTGAIKIEHPEFDNDISTLPSVKTLTYLSKLGCYIVYKEMKNVENQSGDDNKFNIVDNQSTVTDLNGEEVIVGQKRVQLPYHPDGVTL